MITAAILFISAVTVSQGCVPTAAPTTTAPCCPMLSKSVLSRHDPSSSTFEQCSILRRVSSTCPVDGLVICDAAPDTNPTSIQIEFFNAADSVVRTQSVNGKTVTVRVICTNGVWRVPSTSGSATSFPITGVSCSQLGSTGADQGYTIGSAF